MTKIKILAIVFAAILVALALGSCSGVKPQPITTDSQKITAKPTTEITTSTEQTTTVTETVTTGGGTTEPEITSDVTTSITETTSEVSYSTTHEEPTETTSSAETTTKEPVVSTYGTETETTTEETTTVEDTTQAKKTYTLTVKYINRATGGAVKTQAKYTYEDGQEYYITAPAIKGYTPEKGSLSGVITKNATIIFYYVQHEETTESESTEVTESTTEFIASTTEIIETTEATTTTEEPIVTTEETTTPEETTTEEPVQLFTLTVYYVYKNGGTASETHVEHLPYNSSYNVSSPVISGYSVDKAIVSGKLTKNTSVTVTYTKITMYSLTIYYSDYDTAATLSQSHYELLPSGSQYSVDSPAIEGYDLQVASNATISGTLTSDYEVTVWYVKKQGQGQGQGGETPTEKEEQYFLVKLDATKEESTAMNGYTTKYLRVKDKNNNDITIELQIRNQGKLFNRQWVLDHGNNASTIQNQIMSVRSSYNRISDEEKKEILDNAQQFGQTITNTAYYDYCYAYSIKYGNTYLTGDSSTNYIAYNKTKNTSLLANLVYKGGETIKVELKVYLTDMDNNIIQLVYENPNYSIYCVTSASDYQQS